MTTEEVREWYVGKFGMEPSEIFGDDWEREVKILIEKID